MQLIELIETTVKGLGYELVEFETSPRARLLRVFIDRPETEVTQKSSIGVDDCALVSNQLSRVFTVENVDFDRLEVSSPGLDRPLVKAADFRRFAGQEVQLKLRVPLGNQRNFSGVLEGLEDADGTESVRLRVDETQHRFALDNIDRARLVPKFR
ncbi:MAG: ribosome maturation factor RimP [Sulfuritalea sp.]|jgi:ribosome maturation factor RimP|nr:ribosome maturation factor RimP [Sulfuritalea sp.]MBP6636380.1 ribosome maturation factor RimP [Sulfuritalea sp.]MBP7422715.1 ribosome maturation factor RimP [Sulfuritalea sp.]